MRDCTNCQTKPEPGEPYEETPCATCPLSTDDYSISCGTVSFRDWMIPPPMEPEQTSSDAQVIYTYTLSTPKQRARMFNRGSKRIRNIINRYRRQFSRDERIVLTARIRLGLHNRNVFTWLAENTGATKQYWDKIDKQMKRRMKAW